MVSKYRIGTFIFNAWLLQQHRKVYVMRRITIFVFTFVIFLFVLQSFSFAEMKAYIKEYTYNASEFDSKLSSRTTAMAEVKRLLLEELGTYLESETEVKNMQLTKDQIRALTAGIVKTEIIDEKWNGETYWIKTKIVADKDDVIKSIDKLRKDREKSAQLEDAMKRVDALLEENKKLRKDLGRANSDAKIIIQQKYDSSIKELSAMEWMINGFKNLIMKDYITAIESFSKAIALSPKRQNAYVGRGGAYGLIEKYNEAIIDFKKAIAINPTNKDAELSLRLAGYASLFLKKHNDAIAYFSDVIKLNPTEDDYFSRGNAYEKMKKYNEAIVDYGKVIELNPKNAKAYADRALLHYNLKNFNKAIDDFTKLIELDTNIDGVIFFLRARCYGELERYDEAVADFTKAIELNSNDEQAYLNRGVLYLYVFQRYNEAINDFSTMIRLNPQNENAYYYRACSYSMTKNANKAIQDLKNAIKLKPTYGNEAKTEKYFDNISNTKDFKRLVGK